MAKSLAPRPFNAVVNSKHCNGPESQKQERTDVRFCWGLFEDCGWPVRAMIYYLETVITRWQVVQGLSGPVLRVPNSFLRVGNATPPTLVVCMYRMCRVQNMSLD